jgi:archaellum component FlaC
VSVIEEERAMEASSTHKRIDDLSGRVGRFEDRFERFEDKVEARFDKVDARFDKVDARFDKVDARFDKVDGRFERVDESLKGLATKEEMTKLDARFDRWGKIVSGGVVTAVGAIVAGVVAKLLGV